MEAAGEEIPLPELGFPQFWAWFMDCGPVTHRCEGMEPLTSAEVLAWSQLHGIRLSTNEARAMRRLSREYLDWWHLGADMAQEAPWDGDE